ncbi:hypothetical protein C8R47DRAFT_1193459 [Mycena vitilis]|nr:hypothetical protein C8R47DRAFT_1193459 [Mycena vitilis]
MLEIKDSPLQHGGPCTVSNFSPSARSGSKEADAGRQHQPQRTQDQDANSMKAQHAVTTLDLFDPMREEARHTRRAQRLLGQHEAKTSFCIPLEGTNSGSQILQAYNALTVLHIPRNSLSKRKHIMDPDEAQQERVSRAKKMKVEPEEKEKEIERAREEAAQRRAKQQEEVKQAEQKEKEFFEKLLDEMAAQFLSFPEEGDAIPLGFDAWNPANGAKITTEEGLTAAAREIKIPFETKLTAAAEARKREKEVEALYERIVAN